MSVVLRVASCRELPTAVLNIKLSILAFKAERKLVTKFVEFKFSAKKFVDVAFVRVANSVSKFIASKLSNLEFNDLKEVENKFVVVASVVVDRNAAKS